MSMNQRLIFPAAMFVIAGISFAYGTWQYLFAKQVQAAADARLAHAVTTIEESNATRDQKDHIYATLMKELPPAPHTLGFDFSGSFASQDPDDGCTSDGQRAVCSALEREGATPPTYSAVCGVCNP